MFEIAWNYWSFRYNNQREKRKERLRCTQKRFKNRAPPLDPAGPSGIWLSVLCLDAAAGFVCRRAPPAIGVPSDLPPPPPADAPPSMRRKVCRPRPLSNLPAARRPSPERRPFLPKPARRIAGSAVYPPTSFSSTTTARYQNSELCCGCEAFPHAPWWAPSTSDAGKIQIGAMTAEERQAFYATATASTLAEGVMLLTSPHCPTRQRQRQHQRPPRHLRLRVLFHRHHHRRRPALPRYRGRTFCYEYLETSSWPRTTGAPSTARTFSVSPHLLRPHRTSRNRIVVTASSSTSRKIAQTKNPPALRRGFSTRFVVDYVGQLSSKSHSRAGRTRLWEVDLVKQIARVVLAAAVPLVLSCRGRRSRR